MIDLKQRIALITGAGSGLGRSHALSLARCNARVVANDLSSNAVADTVAEIVGEGGTAIGCSGSVTDPTFVQEMVERARRELGPVDILLNNAGILVDRSFSKMTIADFDRVIDVHLKGSLLCTKAVWDGMRERSYGRIIFTTSSSGLYGNFGQANYSAAKMALVGLMQTLSIEGERYNIRVNCLAPSAATGMTEGLYHREALKALHPDAVSPAAVVLSSETSPTRTIMLAGAGGFSQAHVGMTRGIYLGTGPNVADELLTQLHRVGDREGEIVPRQGSEQHAFEVARMHGAVPAM